MPKYNPWFTDLPAAERALDSNNHVDHVINANKIKGHENISDENYALATDEFVKDFNITPLKSKKSLINHG